MKPRCWRNSRAASTAFASRASSTACPTEVSNWACYANNAIWKAAGLDPKKDWPKTWEALPAVAEKLTKRDQNGVPIRRGFDFAWTIPGSFWFVPNTMIHQLGANMIDEETYKAALDTAPSRRGFQFLQDWANKYRLGGPQYTASRTDFLAGKLAAECSFGIWGIPQMQDAHIDWTVMPVPRWADAVADNGIDIYAYYMMVNARSTPEVQNAAWKLARFYTDRAAELFAGAGLFVPRTEVTESAAYKQNSAAPFFLAELKKAKFSPRVVGYTQVLDTILRGRDRLIQGEKIDDVLPVMNEEVNAVMSRERTRAATLVK